jgi:asparagine synthetase B (glutamine-hydrolysing)
MPLIRMYSNADLNQDVIQKALSAIKYSESPVDVGHIIGTSCSNQSLLYKLIKMNIGSEYLKKYSINKAKDITSYQDQLSFNEIEEYLVSDILVKVDRATMSQGLEGREPLLNHELFEYAASLPDDFKYRNGSGKFILKDIVHKYIPEEIMSRPKMGFGIPVRDWMRSEMKDVFYEALVGDGLDRMPELNRDLIRTLANRYFKGDNSHFQLLWYVYNYSKWKEAWDFIE